MQIIETRKVRNTTLAIYSVDGRRAASFVPAGVDAAAWLSESLGLSPVAPELGRVAASPVAHKGGVKVKVEGTASMHAWSGNTRVYLAEGDKVSVDGTTYIYRGEGRQWKEGREWMRYAYLDFADVANIVEVAAPAKSEPLATAKQVAYAVRLGATNPSYTYDALPCGRAYTRAQLAQLTRSEISYIIDELRAA